MQGGGVRLLRSRMVINRKSANSFIHQIRDINQTLFLKTMQQNEELPEYDYDVVGEEQKQTDGAQKQANFSFGTLFILSMDPF